MSVTEADVMTLMGEQVTLGPRQTAEYSAALERQYAYEAQRAADFGNVGSGISGLPLSAVPLITAGALGRLTSFGSSGFGAVRPTTRLYQNEGQSIPPFVTPGDMIPRVFPGDDTLPPGKRVIPVPELPPIEPLPPLIRFGVGDLLAGVIAAIWTGWPNALGSGERQPGDRPPVKFPPPGGLRPPDIGQGPVPDTIYGPPFPDFPQVGLPMPAPPVEGSGDDIFSRARKAMEDQLIKDMTTPAPVMTPAPAPAPAPSSRHIDWGKWAAIGALPALLISRRRRRGVGSSLTSVEDALLESAANVAPGLSYSSAPMTDAFLSGGDEHCNCRKKGGKKRKCLARAQLSWRSGPKKGKAAGSRCIRFAT